MFFGETNKNYLNKHNSLMFNGYQINKGTVFKYTNNNILSENDKPKNYYKQSQLLDRYNIVVNNPSIKILNRNTDFRKKYYGYDVNKKKNDSFYDEVENETIIKHDIIPLKNNIITNNNAEYNGGVSVRTDSTFYTIVENNIISYNDSRGVSVDRSLAEITNNVLSNKKNYVCCNAQRHKCG